MAPGWLRDGPRWLRYLKIVGSDENYIKLCILQYFVAFQACKIAQDSPKMSPRWPQDGQSGPKMAPDGPEDVRKMPQDGSGWPETSFRADRKAPNIMCMPSPGIMCMPSRGGFSVLIFN